MMQENITCGHRKFETCVKFDSNGGNVREVANNFKVELFFINWAIPCLANLF